MECVEICASRWWRHAVSLAAERDSLPSGAICRRLRPWSTAGPHYRMRSPPRAIVTIYLYLRFLCFAIFFLCNLSFSIYSKSSNYSCRNIFILPNYNYYYYFKERDGTVVRNARITRCREEKTIADTKIFFILDIYLHISYLLFYYLLTI